MRRVSRMRLPKRCARSRHTRGLRKAALAHSTGHLTAHSTGNEVLPKIRQEPGRAQQRTQRKEVRATLRRVPCRPLLHPSLPSCRPCPNRLRFRRCRTCRFRPIRTKHCCVTSKTRWRAWPRQKPHRAGRMLLLRRWRMRSRAKRPGAGRQRQPRQSGPQRPRAGKPTATIYPSPAQRPKADISRETPARPRAIGLAARLRAAARVARQTASRFPPLRPVYRSPLRPV